MKQLILLLFHKAESLGYIGYSNEPYGKRDLARKAHMLSQLPVGL